MSILLSNRTGLILSCLLAPVLAAAQFTFGPATYIQPVVPNKPGACTFVDMDSDGDIDILVGSDSRGCKLGWLEQNDEGEFTDQHCIALPESYPYDPNTIIYQLRLADIDNDGDQDAVVGIGYTGEIGWLEFENGEAQAYTPIATEVSGVKAMAVGDINGDGYLDVAWSASGFIGWSSNDGGGSFDMPETLGTWSYDLMQLADLNGDGALDLVVAGSGLDWFPNEGEGFGARIELEGSENYKSIHVIDLNADDEPDLLYQVQGFNDSQWMPNLGGGILDDAQAVPLTMEGEIAIDVVPIDFNTDGLPDLVRLYGDDSIDWLRNLPENPGTFMLQEDASSNYPWDSTPSERFFLPTADINADGQLDVNYISGGMLMTNRRYLGNLFANAECLMCGPRNPEGIEHVDADGDGDYDLLASSHYPAGIFIYENNGDGTFQLPKRATAAAFHYNIQDFFVTNTSTDADLIIWSIESGDDILTKYHGGSSYAYFNQQDLFVGSWPGTPKFYPAGVFGDCANRLLVRDSSPISVSLISFSETELGTPILVDGPHTSGYQNFTLHNWYSGYSNGVVYSINGTFGLNFAHHLTCGEMYAGEEVWPQNPNVVVPMDVDNEGHDDILVGDADGNYVYIEINGSDWTFGHVVHTDIEANFGTALSNPMVADFDGDGDHDLLSGGTTLSVSNHWMDGDIPVFDALEEVAVLPWSHDDAITVDFDEDGIADFAAVCQKEVVVVINTTGDYGCNDLEACNYSESAIFDDGSCCYGVCGCNDEAATNFNPLADCSDACLYPVNGWVYHDQNVTEQWEETEDLLPFITVSDTEGLSSSITSDDGLFQLHLPVGEHLVEVQNPVSYPFTTTAEPVLVTVPQAAEEPVAFGLSIDEPAYLLEVDFYAQASTFLCSEWEYFDVCFRNMGNQLLDGYIAVEYDELFQDFFAVTPIDSVVGSTLYFGYEALEPGEQRCYSLQLLTPSVDFLGEDLLSVAQGYGFVDEELEAFGQAELPLQVLCAYDPNDKQVLPAGYTDAHLILNDTELEYLVRFQNTGNAPAQQVLLRDTLDANLDLSTFALVSNSHPVVTTVDAATREVTFLFEDIQLPDSTCCEPESHGFVTFNIRPVQDLSEGTVLENTAYIYFDNNDAIITNTTWNTIHECAESLTLTPAWESDCPASTVQLTSDVDLSIPWETAYTWTFEELWLSDQPVLDIQIPLGSPAEVLLTASNPLCTETGTVTLDLNPDTFWTTCLGDLNCDMQVNATDVVTFLGQFECEGVTCSYDVNGDGEVGSSDLLLVLGEFGVVCE